MAPLFAVTGAPALQARSAGSARPLTATRSPAGMPGICRQRHVCRVKLDPFSGKDGEEGAGQGQQPQDKDKFGGPPPSDAKRLMPRAEQLAEEEGGSGSAAPAGAQGQSGSAGTGMVFQPMSEVAPVVRELDPWVNEDPGLSAGHSFARMDFRDSLEAGLNEQIKPRYCCLGLALPGPPLRWSYCIVQYNMSYVYHSLHAYFNRDNVGLPGFAAYYKHNSDEERQHAQKLIDYQNIRGGRVKLLALTPPDTEYWHAEKGDALNAAELALSLEKLNFRKLRDLHALADAAHDADMTHYIEDELLHEQSRDVKDAAVLVSQLRRAGRGHGVFHIDTLLSNKYGDVAAGGPIAG